MTWRVEFDEAARRQLRSLDKATQARVLSFIRDRIAGSDNPRSNGAPLKGSLAGLWRYRMGDYRIICRILDGELVILVLKVAHRREAYR